MPNMDSATQFDPTAQARMQGAVERVLRALARVLLRQGFDYAAFSELAKRVFISVASEEFGIRNRPASKSRVALLTGINRRDVARVQRQVDADQPAQVFNPMLRLVALWIREPAYRTDAGLPRQLPVNGPAPSLEALRGRACPDIPITAVVRELLQSGVARSGDDDATRPGSLVLVTDAYVPREDVTAKLDLMGTDVAALLNTIGWNIEQPAAPRFQRKVSFDHLTQAGVERLQAFAAESGMQLLKTLDAELVQHSTDEGGEFAGLGIYVFSESGQAGRAR